MTTKRVGISKGRRFFVGAGKNHASFLKGVIKRNSRRNSKKPTKLKQPKQPKQPTPCALRANAQIIARPSPPLLRRVPACYTFSIGSKQSVLLCDLDRKKEMEGVSRVVDALVDLQS